MVRPVDTPRLVDADAERARRAHAEAIRELQANPAVGLRILEGIELPDATTVIVAHGLGRRPLWVSSGIPRGASTTGRIDDITPAADRDRTLSLKASGYGATITIDLAVM